MKSASKLGTWLATALLMGACGSDDVRTPAVPTAPPIALEDALLYTTLEPGDEGKARSLIVDLRTSTPRVQKSELPEGEVKTYARSGHEGEALVLTTGAEARLEDGEGRDAVPSHVLLFDRDGERSRIALSASYAALTVSDDGRYAIAHQPGGPWSSADSIAVIDLDKDGGEQPVAATMVRALDGKGPSAVAFAPPSNARRLAVLVMTDAINVLDLARPDRKDKVLPLKLPNGTGALRAKKVVFAGDHCFVQADTGTDIFSVRFEDDASGFRASLSTFATESVVQDMHLLPPDEGTGRERLLVLGTNSLRLIDIKSGKSESSATGMQFGSAALFVGTTPFDDVARPRALLYAESATRLGFVDLNSDLAGSERTVEILSLSGAVSELVLLEQKGIAIALQKDKTVSLIDLSERTVSSLSAGDDLRELVIDERAGVERAWVLTTGGTLGAIDLARRSASQVLLSRSASAVVPLSGNTPRLVVEHNAESGALTVLDAAKPTRSTAREIFGFLFSNYLD